MLVRLLFFSLPTAHDEASHGAQGTVMILSLRCKVGPDFGPEMGTSEVSLFALSAQGRKISGRAATQR